MNFFTHFRQETVRLESPDDGTIVHGIKALFSDHIAVTVPSLEVTIRANHRILRTVGGGGTQRYRIRDARIVHSSEEIPAHYRLKVELEPDIVQLV